MEKNDWLATEFETTRHHLQAVAYRMLGSRSEAEDAVLDTLTAAERIAFVLHDLFDLSFDEIAPIIERTELATRQLASRARRRVRGASMPNKDAERQQEVVAAFMQASRQGNFDALLRLLHPDVVLRADETAIKVSTANKARGAPQFTPEIIGAKAVADTLNGSAQGAQLSLVNGLAGATWGMNGKTVVAFCFAVNEGKITAIDIVMDKNTLGNFDIHIIDNNSGVNV